MSYNTDELEQLALKAIKDNDLVFISEVSAFLPGTLKTLYNHELQNLQSIKEALYENRTKQKQSLRKKWRDSENATLNVAFYKLVADEDEYNRLATIKQDVKTNEKPTIIFQSVSQNQTDETSETDND